MMTNDRHVDNVRRYYERNTALFAHFGSRASAGSVHRALWPTGVRSLDEALRFSHRLVADELHKISTIECVVDLGCGVGGALLDLRPHLPSAAVLFGMTLSRAQALLAAQRTAGAAYIVEGNFLAVPLRSASCDLVYSIEAFAHAPGAGVYLAEAARLLRSGGRLVLLDDTVARASASPVEENLVAVFRIGWGVPSVLPVDALAKSAAQHGLRLQRADDLTSWLRLRALPLQLIAPLLHWTRAWWRCDPVLAATAGSIALQTLLAIGLIRYRCLVFERVE